GELELRRMAAEGSKYHRWLLYSRTLRRHEALVAYYTFEGDQPNRLINRADATRGRLDAFLKVGNPTAAPRWTDGPWPGKRALAWQGLAGQYAVIPHDTLLDFDEAFTFAAWVRPEPYMIGTLFSKRQGAADRNTFQASVVLTPNEDRFPRSVQFITGTDPEKPSDPR